MNTNSESVNENAIYHQDIVNRLLNMASNSDNDIDISFLDRNISNFISEMNMKMKTENDLDTDSYSDSQSSLSEDDEFDVSQGVVYEVYNNRYIPIKYIGRGSFSRVWLTYDLVDNKLCGMKCIFQKYSEESIDEIKRNRKITSELDFSQDIRLLQMYDNFSNSKGETCIVYELMGVSMIEVIQYYDNMLPLDIVKKVTTDVLYGLKSLHNIRFIHTDLKPDNILTNIYTRGMLFYKNIFEVENNFREIYDKLILEKLPENYSEMDKNKRKKVKRNIRIKLVNQIIDKIKDIVVNAVEKESSKFYKTHTNETNIEDIDLDIENLEENPEEENIYTFTDYQNEITISKDDLESQIRAKLIDFGNCEYMDDKIQDEICVRCYRPPENYMNSFYNEKADIWSLGCLIFEFLTGEYLFDIEMVDEANERDILYLSEMISILGPIPRKLALNCEYSRALFNKKGQLRNIDYKELENNAKSISIILVDDYNYVQEVADEIESVLRQFLNYNYKKRLSADEALKLSWFN